MSLKRLVTIYVSVIINAIFLTVCAGQSAGAELSSERFAKEEWLP